MVRFFWLRITSFVCLGEVWDVKFQNSFGLKLKLTFLWERAAIRAVIRPMIKTAATSFCSCSTILQPRHIFVIGAGKSIRHLAVPD